MLDYRGSLRSSRTGAFSTTAFYLLAILVGLVLSPLINFAWWSIPAIGHNQGYNQWIDARSRGTIDLPELAALRSSIAVIARDIANDVNRPADVRLVKAKYARRDCLPASNMFGNANIQVYPRCVTRASATRLGLKPAPDTSLESVVFSSFARHVMQCYDNVSHSRSPDSNTERTLARALGQCGGAGSSLESSFAVPWIYVASRQGAIAVFPGTSEIGTETWYAPSRPWYQAAFNSDVSIAQQSETSTAELTAPYLDILNEQPDLVRTYFVVLPGLHATGGPPQDFVLAVDLFRNPSSAAVSLASANAIMSPPWWRVSACTIAALLLLFFVIRWMSTFTRASITFKRVGKGEYGDLEPTKASEIVQSHRKTDSSTRVLNVGAKFREWFFISLTDSTEEESSSGENDNLSIVKKLGQVRGVEVWDIRYNEITSWKVLGIPFESAAVSHVGRAALYYGHLVLPVASWLDISKVGLPIGDVDRWRESLLNTLRENAAEWQVNRPAAMTCRVDIPMTDAVACATMPKLDTLTGTVVDRDVLGAVNQHRAYVNISEQALAELYRSADVQAVIQSSYFERALELGNTEFLLLGRTIARLVLLPKDVPSITLSTQSAEKNYGALSAAYDGSSRRLCFGRGTLKGHEQRPVYDFAILNGTHVIVTHTVRKTVEIDPVSGIEDPHRGYRVEGYISWRLADVTFYQELFQSLITKAGDAPVIRHQNESPKIT